MSRKQNNIVLGGQRKRVRWKFSDKKVAVVLIQVSGSVFGAENKNGIRFSILALVFPLLQSSIFTNDGEQ